jgi:DHA2 family multidrug resistance protein
MRRNYKVANSAVMRILIVTAVMSATLMQVLDITIVNVALPHMQGALGATTDQITWVLTSYLVACAILMPLTGYFTDRFGRKKYLLISIGGFVVTSALCGASENIAEIVIFRLLQGIFGAALVPLSQAIMCDAFPKEDRGMAMALWGMGVMVGPVLGPTLGGYLTDLVSWRWNFYINIPIGILSFLLSMQVVPDTPRKSRRMDWTGFLLIAISIGGTQYFLDRGNLEDWLNSNTILIAIFISFITFIGFLLYVVSTKKHTVFNLAIFRDTNFTVSSLLLAIFGSSLYGSMVIAPIMLEHLFNYPALTAGLVLAPRGLAGMFSMFFAGKMMRYIDSRWLIISGIFFSIISVLIGTNYNLYLSPGWIIWPFVLQGIGIGLVMVPLSTLAFSTLPQSNHAEAAGLFSLMRTLGNSLGISMAISLFSRGSQTAWNQLGGWITPYHFPVSRYLHSLNLSVQDPLAIRVLAEELKRQSQMISFLKVYEFIAISLLIMIPMVLLLKKQVKN